MKLDSIKDYPEDESWPLSSKDMPVVTSTIHMGILRTSTNQEMHNVEASILKAKRTIYILMGSGMHRENVLDPETAISYKHMLFSFTVLWTGSNITHWKSIGYLGYTIQKTKQNKTKQKKNCYNKCCPIRVQLLIQQFIFCLDSYRLKH